MARLEPSAIDDLLKTAPDWKLEDGKLVRDWTFKDFVQAMEFVNHIAQLAETANHHPDIDVRYNRVRLGLVSHDAGGITARDAKMVIRIDREFL